MIEIKVTENLQRSVIKFSEWTFATNSNCNHFTVASNIPVCVYLEEIKKLYFRDANENEKYNDHQVLNT